MGREDKIWTLSPQAVKKEYKDTVALLIEVAPTVFAGGEFALKGGTALNLFVRDMPRLSVDIDLVYPSYEVPRDEALKQISGALARAKDKFVKSGFKVAQSGSSSEEAQLQINRGSLTVKVEANYVFRGTVLPIGEKILVNAAQQAFKVELTVPSLDTDELYGSKLVAFFDRQHPRDIFDVRELLLHGTVTDRMRQCFVVYLAGHNRPIHEVLSGRAKDIEAEFINNFEGMTTQPISLKDLLAVRESVFASLPASLNDEERSFLMSIAKADPRWDVMPFRHLRQLPALQWKLHNLQQLRDKNRKKFDEQGALLEEVFARAPRPKVQAK